MTVDEIRDLAVASAVWRYCSEDGSLGEESERPSMAMRRAR